MRRGLACIAAAVSVVVLLGDVLPARSTLTPRQRPLDAPGRRASPAGEFVGPFASWADVTRRYGAVGDGRADDTAALQRALDELRKDGRSPVLFLPAGTYRITRTLRLAYEMHVSLIGEDPESVAIVWDGPRGGTMLWVNGVAYSRISRITFDGRTRAAVAIDQSADGTGGHFDTGNHYVDDRFVDVGTGLRGGFGRAGGFAETSIVRAHFIRNTQAGVALGNFNALDIWIWNSLFDHCRVGVTNDPGAGNYRVYDSLFIGSTQADLVMQNTGSFTARGNRSFDSGAFFVSGAPINHPALIDIHANVIVDPRSTTAIRLSNQGPGLLLDNVVRSRPGAQGPVVRWQSGIDADVVSVGNTFTTAGPLSVSGRLWAVDDRIVPRASVGVPGGARPMALPRRSREVHDVPAGSGSVEIQQAIDRAARRAGAKPVVHLPAGTYRLSSTIVIPPGDLQVIGDGGDTRLVWVGPPGGAVISVSGPTTADLGEFSVEGAAGTDGIVVSGVDQPGARISLSGTQVSAGRENNLRIDGLRHARVQLVDIDHKYLPAGVSLAVQDSHVTLFSGASSGNALSYDIGGASPVVVRDIWYEGTTTVGFARIRDGARFTLQGARVSTPAGGPDAVVVDNSRGRTAILTTHLDDRVVLSGRPPMRVLGLGLLFEFHDRAVLDVSAAAGAGARLVQSRRRAEVQGRVSPGSTPLPNAGREDATALRELLADTRTVVSPDWEPVPPGTTDLRLDGVFITGAERNIVVRP